MMERVVIKANDILTMYLLNMSKAEEDWFSHCVEMRGFDKAVEELRKERAQGSIRHERAVEYLKVEDLQAMKAHAVSVSRAEADAVMLDVMTALALSAAQGYDSTELAFSKGSSLSRDGVIFVNIPREDPILEFNTVISVVREVLGLLEYKGFVVDVEYQEDEIFARARVEW